MAANSETEINLKTLQRVDSNIIEIIDNASQVAIYKYDRKLEKWEGTDIEGTLFLYKRSFYPYHGFIIVNRMSTTNFIESVTSDMQFQLQEPYLLYKNHSGDIIGSWFYEDRDLRRITNKIQTIVLTQVSTPKRQRCASESDTHPKKDEVVVPDIMTLLSQAHEEYVKNVEKTDVNAHGSKNHASHLQKKDEIEHSTCTHIIKNSKISTVLQDYPISPRKRYLSTGSFDLSSSSPVSVANKEFSNEKLMCIGEKNYASAVENKEQTPSKNTYPVHFNTDYVHSSCKYESSPILTRLSPLFSQEEISSPPLSDIGILENSFDLHEEQSHPNSESAFKRLCFPNLNTNFGKSRSYINSNLDLHSACIKQALSSHLEADSGILLKIHEAYISSLKSLFTQTKIEN